MLISWGQSRQVTNFTYSQPAVLLSPVKVTSKVDSVESIKDRLGVGFQLLGSTKLPFDAQPEPVVVKVRVY